MLSDVRLLNDISDLILHKGNVVNSTEIILKIINENVSTLFGVYLLVENDELVLKAYSTSFFTVLSKIIPIDVYAIKYPLKDTRTLITDCVNNDKVIVSDCLKDFFYPVFSWPYILESIQLALKIKSCIAVPIRLQSEAIGALFFASKTNFSKEEIDILQLYANLSAIAIDNCRTLNLLEENYKSEKATTAMLSHELKTPIAIAHNSMQLLDAYARKDDYLKSKKQYKSVIEDLEKSIRRLDYVCNSIFTLMDTENRDNSIIHKFNLDKQFGQLVNSFERKAQQKGLTFIAEIPKSKKVFVGGGVQMEQILMIFLDNAIKYTKKGSVELIVKINKRSIVSQVRDTGPGIPKRAVQKVFEKFYRHRSFSNFNLIKIEGLGLGLYIAQKIAEKINGTIKYEKKPHGKGSVFTLEIPIYDDKVD
jgi:signal transduction histidine kinase